MHDYKDDDDKGSGDGKKQIRDNPPITENQIKAMYAKMGRKLSETQVKEIMRSIKNQK